MVRHQIERELEIDEAEIFAAPAPERGAQAVQRFGGAVLRVVTSTGSFSPALSFSMSAATSGWFGSVLLESPR